MKTGKAILNIALAAAAGVAIGILFAPEKGARTRRRIMERGEDCAQGLEDLKSAFKRALQNY